MTRPLCLRLGFLVLCLLLGGLLLVTPTRGDEKRGKKYALLVGVRQYNHDKLTDLKYTEADVEELATLLKKPASGFHDVRILTTTRGKKDKDDVPTAANIRKALENLLERKTRDDTILVALAGHTFEIEVKDPTDKGPAKSFQFFCPCDADPTSFRVSYTTGRATSLINFNDLFRDIDMCGAGTRLVLSDADGLDLNQLSVAGRVGVLFSATSGQRPFEDEKVKHGLFYHGILEGLGGKAANENGEVTWDSLSAYVKKVVPKLAEALGGGAKQTPHGMGGTEGEVVLATGLTPIKLPAFKADASTRGKGHALLVGVKDYGKRTTLDPLKYTENDVEELARILDRPGSPYHQRVRVLTSTRGKADKADMPTAENIRKALAALVKGKDENDTVLVALSGHGIQLSVRGPKAKDKEKSYAYFCPQDADLPGADYETGRHDQLLLLSDLLGDLGECGAGTKLLLMDACRNERSSPRSLRLNKELVPEGVAALFSCKTGQQSFEVDKLKHGVFFHHVIAALKGEAKDSRDRITWSRMVEHVTEKVEEHVPEVIGGGAKQTPHEIKNLAGATPVLLGPVREVARGADTVKKYALLIGPSEFESTKFPNLKYVENDIEELLGVLQSRAANFTSVRVLTTGRGKKDAKDKPTADNIRAALRELAKGKQKNDLILVAFAGIGGRILVEDPGKKRRDRTYEFLMPSDADNKNVDFETGSSRRMISLAELSKELEGSGAGTKLVLLDASRNELHKARAIDVNDVGLKAGSAWLFACKAGENAHETPKLGKGHGIFFYHVIEALKGKARNADGEVTWDHLASYVRRSVVRDVEKHLGEGRRQTPATISNLRGDPVLARYP